MKNIYTTLLLHFLAGSCLASHADIIPTIKEGQCIQDYDANETNSSGHVDHVAYHGKVTSSKITSWKASNYEIRIDEETGFDPVDGSIDYKSVSQDTVVTTPSSVEGHIIKKHDLTQLIQRYDGKGGSTIEERPRYTYINDLKIDGERTVTYSSKQIAGEFKMGEANPVSTITTHRDGSHEVMDDIVTTPYQIRNDPQIKVDVLKFENHCTYDYLAN